MFHDEDELAAYEDELYREESSSDDGPDSEVEAYLYSQLHYSQNPSEDNIEDPMKEDNKKTNGPDNKSVIVISDSDDVRASDSSAVMILSDSLEEDSVYRSKLKSKVLSAVQQPELQSTPKASLLGKKSSKLQGPKSARSGKSYKDGIVQEVLVIRGSSDDEDVEDHEEVLLSSDSDQSDVENWMLLGRTKEDGDASIQLNLQGHRSPSEDTGGVEWSVIERDSEAPLTRYTPLRPLSNRYYTEDKNVICRNCNFRGHLSKSCPQPKKLPACCLCGTRGHLQYSCPDRYCSNCFIPGHFHKDCTERPYWLKKCHRCCMIGHYADACPDVWRQYHLTVVPGPMKTSNSSSNPKQIVYCCNCGRKGHCGYECKQKRMCNTIYPGCELVSAYDQSRDIRERNNRAKRRLRDLQEAGLVTFETEETYIQDTVDDTTPPEKLRKRNKRHGKKLKKLEDMYSSKKFKKEKKKMFLQQEEAEEYFPRGRTEKPQKARKAHVKKKAQHILFTDFSNNERSDDQLHKHKKRRKRMRQRSSAADESLFLIKQKRKKSKTGK
ncbi:zinc finger CCHC domain-containing protein 7 [Eleutherodactylus coqui]|uniref:Zinc finger CCHC domain-containing protein 7 n=1 Tax=Eleutherodactylus coqui TaxID=57060 RepID=A0A8J6FFU0_ELECQ|nr:hypothetical protein GDO78_006756 [Eleutherodactylus coqui]